MTLTDVLRKLERIPVLVDEQTKTEAPAHLYARKSGLFRVYIYALHDEILADLQREADYMEGGERN